MDVRSLQYYLDVLSYFNDAVPDIDQDGYFGPATAAAVRAFQTLAGLPADGIVGLQTWLRLRQAYDDILEMLPPGIKESNAEDLSGIFLSPGYGK